MMMISIEITMPAITGPILMSESSLSAVMLSGNTVTKQNMILCAAKHQLIHQLLL